MATAIPNLDPAIDKPPRRRRRIPLSLRMLVAILAILGAGSTFLVVSVWLPYQRELQVIQRTGGYLGTTVTAETVCPEWLQTIVGINRIKEFRIFERVRFVDLTNSEVSDTDASLALLSRLTNLRSLYLDHTAVTDAGLVHLSELKQLEVLSLESTRVTDDGLAAR